MLDNQPAHIGSLLVPENKSAQGHDKRVRWFEVGLVVLVAFGSPLFNSLYLLKFGPRLSSQMSGLGSLASAFHEVTALLLVGYILWRRGRGFHDIGFRWSLRDFASGPVVAAVSWLSYWAGALFVQGLHYFIYRAPATGHTAKEFFGRPSIFALSFVLLNPFFEELIVRAYLMTEVIELTGSKALAIALSTVLQAVYHLYYGWWIATAIAFGFLVFAVYYARTRRAVPIIIAHALFDLYGFLRLF